MPDTLQLQDQFYIRVAGSLNEELMADQLEVIVESSLQLPDVATLVIHDTKLKWVDDKSIEPGTELKISALTDGSEQPVFDGEIVEIEPDFREASQKIYIRAYDRLHRLARGRHVRSYQNVTDGDLIKKVAQELGLQADVGATSQVYPYVLQANETNLSFLQRRASALGYVLFMDGKKLCCKAPDADGAEVELKWAETLMEFRPRMTTVDQVSTNVVRGWDPQTRQEIVGTVQKGEGAPSIGESRSGGDLAKSAFSIDAQYLTADRPVRSQGEADQLAKAFANRRTTSFVQADGVCKGNAKIVAGTKLKVSGCGDRFSGSYVVTNARHIYDRSQEGFLTEFSVSGQHPDSLLTLLRPESGSKVGEDLAIGIVTNNDDPDKLGRVKVKFPWLSPDHESNWARVVAPGGGPKRGIEFLPEINDEVLIGFELGDVNHPYVLGGLWNGKDKPPGEPSKVIAGSKVEQRIIKSRVGHTITLDDSDGACGIKIEDKNGNVIHLETSSSDSLKIKTKGDITIETNGNVKTKAQQNVTIEGSQIELKAQLGVTIDGGGGMVDVKGVMINLN